MVEYVCEVRTCGEVLNSGHYFYEERERVTRCKDCKYAYEIDGTDELNCLYFNQWDYRNDRPGEWRVEPDGFCKWGEPRDVE